MWEHRRWRGAPQAQARWACELPEIRQVVQRELARLVMAVSELSGADAASVQRFVAYGQLCHLILQAAIIPIEETWAHALREPIGRAVVSRHYSSGAVHGNTTGASHLTTGEAGIRLEPW